MMTQVHYAALSVAKAYSHSLGWLLNVNCFVYFCKVENTKDAIRATTRIYCFIN